MARKVNLIAEINDTKETWKLAVRITNLWYVPSPRSTEIVFMDGKGNKIQATIKGNDIDKWKSQLREGNTYIVQNFGVQCNNGEYRASNHPFRLVFNGGTIVKEQDLPEIAQNVYYFTNFEDILSGEACTDVLVDVIGHFMSKDVSEPNTKKRWLFSA